MIIVTGSLAYDYIMDFPGKFADRILPDKIHQISLSFLVDRLHKGMGGTAGNIAYSLALLGSNVAIVESVGQDFSPYKSFLETVGVITEYIHTVADEYTGLYFGITDQSDNQIGAFHIGASKFTKNLTLQPFSQDDLTLIGPSSPEAIANFIDECHARHIPYVFDPAFQIGVLSPETLRLGIEGAQVLFGNDYEIAMIEKKLGMDSKNLLDHTMVIVKTLGSEGSIIYSKDKTVKVAPAIPTETIDPTGAGDAYRAGFMAGFTRGFDLETCGQMGSVAAVYSVEKYGTTTHRFTKEEFITRFHENYDKPLTL